MGRRTGRCVLLLLAAAMLAACTESEVSPAPEAASRSENSLSPSKPARDVARQATGAVPKIVNPAEELLEFDPQGLLRWSEVPGATAYELWNYSNAGSGRIVESGASAADCIPPSPVVKLPPSALQVERGQDADGRDDLINSGAYYPNEPYPAKFPFPSMLSIHAREYAVVDLSKDGINDLYVADHGYDANPFPGFRNQLFLSQGGQAQWVDATSVPPGDSGYTHSVTTGDVNGDGSVDIFVGNDAVVTLPCASVMFANGAGGLVANYAVLPMMNSGLTALHLVDFDGNGLPELVTGVMHSFKLNQVYWNQGGSYASQVPTFLAEPVNFGNEWGVMDIQSTDQAPPATERRDERAANAGELEVADLLHPAARPERRRPHRFLGQLHGRRRKTRPTIARRPLSDSTTRPSNRLRSACCGLQVCRHCSSSTTPRAGQAHPDN